MQEILFLEFMVDPARWNYLICIRFIRIIKKNGNVKLFSPSDDSPP